MFIGGDVVQRLLIYSYFVSTYMLSSVRILSLQELLQFTLLFVKHRTVFTKRKDPTRAILVMSKGVRTK